MIRFTRRDLAAVLLASAGAPVACDASRDTDYRGEALHVVAVVVDAESAAVRLLAPDSAVVVALQWWSSEPGGAAVRVGDDAFDIASDRPDGITAHLRKPPPDIALRSLASGRLAIGQLVAYQDRDGDRQIDPDEPFVGGAETLVAFAPDGLAADEHSPAMSPGFHTVRASGPCDAPAVSFHEATGPTQMTLSERAAAFSIFSGTTCLGDAALWPDVDRCPDLDVIRWLCRFAPSPAPYCDLCLPLVFPSGATTGVCDRWLARCEDLAPIIDVSLDECRNEWRICTLGDFPAVTSCDLACVCDAYQAECLARGSPADVCGEKGRLCNWL